MGPTHSDVGTSRSHPIRVGGGFLFGAFNQRQYLSRLRLPDGQVPSFKRMGSTIADGAPGPLDMYELSAEGQPSAAQLLLDVYTRAALVAPPGFSLVNTPALDHLPWGIGSPPDWRGLGEPVEEKPLRWRVVGEANQVAGFADWDGNGVLALKLTPHIQQLMQRQLDHFMGLAPAHRKAEMLVDFFERYLPLESGGFLRGVTVGEPALAPWTGERWGMPGQPPARKKWYWPW